MPDRMEAEWPEGVVVQKMALDVRLNEVVACHEDGSPLGEVAAALRGNQFVYLIFTKNDGSRCMWTLKPDDLVPVWKPLNP